MARKKRTTHSSGLCRKRVTLGHNPKTGEPIRKSVYGHTMQEVENKIAKLRIERGMGVCLTDDRTTWHYWAEAWKKLTEPSVSAGTWLNYETALKHLSVFDGEKISKITSLEIESFINEKFKEGYSKRTLALLRGTASRVFKTAKRNNAVLQNPCEDVSIPKSAPVTSRCAISKEVQEKLWNLQPMASDSPERAARLKLIRMFALIQLSCGLRRGEAAGLQWRDINLKRRDISISRSLDFKTGRLKGPKSAAGNRCVPIPDRLIPELKAWKRGHSAGLFVFEYHGKLLTSTEFVDLWSLLLDELNNIALSDRIKDGIAAGKRTGRRRKLFRPIAFTSHQLRHTFASNAIAAGIDVRSVQYLLGHASPEMTLAVYTHASPRALSEARQKLNEYDSFKESNGVNSVQKGQ